MLPRLDVLLIGLGFLLAFLGAIALDLWLLVASCRSLFRRDGFWGLFGVILSLIILGAAGLYFRLMSEVVLGLAGYPAS